MKIYDFVESEKQFYESDNIPLMDGDDFSQYQLIRAISFARRNKYMDDNATDAIIGDFPYDNISKYRIRLEARSTDFDIKHIEVEPVDSSDEARVSAMIASKALLNKMREIKFDRFLNTYADIRPEYGAFLAKKTMDGVHYVPWQNVVTDMTDILNSPIIEKHYLSPAQLKKTNWDNVDEAIKTAAENKRDKDLKAGSADSAHTVGRFIEVYEITGEMPLATLLEAQEKEWTAEDENEFVLCHIVYAPFGKNKRGENIGVTLKADELDEKDYHYKLDVRHPLAGRAMGEGIVEELAEHQRWHNFYKTEEARAVAIGGKVLFITNDGAVVDSIYSGGIEHGTILQVGDDKEFRQLTTMPNSVPVYQNITSSWSDSADKNTSSFDAVIGEESKSGTPFRSQYLQNIAGTSQFEREREDMSFFVKELVEDWLLPEALEEASKLEEIDSFFSKQELDLIDRVIVNKAAIDFGVDSLLNKKQVVTPEANTQFMNEARQDLRRKGARRGVKDIAEFIKKAGKKVVIHTSDAERSKMVEYESLSNAMMLFAENDPARMALRDKVLDMMGVSSQELAMYAQQAAETAEALPTPAGQLKTTELNKEEALAPVI